jgi:hypothetical protein
VTLDLTLDAPPDASLLAELVDAVEEGRAPSQAALEEVAALAERRGDVACKLRRLRGLRVVEQVRRANAGASERTIAKLAARRLGETAECVRAWVRSAVLPTHDLGDAGDAHEERKEPGR